MPLRRLFAVLTCLPMFHLALVGSDLACATHGHGSAHVMASMAMAAGSALSSAPVQPPCDTPSQPRCCEAMSSCGVTTTVGPSQELAAVDFSTTRVLGTDRDALRSFQAAPEPPPPKA